VLAGVYQRGGGRFLLVAILVRVIVPVLWKTAPATASSTKKHWAAILTARDSSSSRVLGSKKVLAVTARIFHLCEEEWCDYDD